MNQIIDCEIQKLAYFTEQKFDIFAFNMFCYIAGLIIGICMMDDIHKARYQYSISNLRDLIIELYERINDRPNDRTNDNDEPVDLSQ
jgi:hypothetical protein